MFRLAQELRHAVFEEETAVRLELKAQRLAEEVSRHFRHEERLMREARYPQMEWHKRQHASARADLARLADAIRAADQDATFASLEAISRWIRDHTAVADRMAGAYLRNHQRASAR